LRHHAEQQRPQAWRRGRQAGAPAAVETKPIARIDLTSKPAPGNPLKDPKNILSRRSIYFDFDKFESRTSSVPDRGALRSTCARARGEDAIQAMPTSAQPRVQPRSRAAPRRQRQAGADAPRRQENQIESVSLGEEKPVCTEHAELLGEEPPRHMLYNGEY